MENKLKKGLQTTSSRMPPGEPVSIVKPERMASLLRVRISFFGQRRIIETTFELRQRFLGCGPLIPGMTFFVVAFSILAQGLTIGRFYSDEKLAKERNCSHGSEFMMISRIIFEES